MKICFIGNMNSNHMTKWVEYFIDKEGEEEIRTFHVSKWWKTFKELCLYRIFWLIKSIIYDSFKPDILHAHYAGLCGLIGALINYHPFIVTVWGSDVLINSKSWLKRPFIKWILKKADLITCDGDDEKEVMIRKLDVPGEKIKIIRFGVDVEKFKPGLVSKWPNPAVASLRTYDLETLRKALSIVQKRMPLANCHFMLARNMSPEVIPHLLNNAWIYVDTSPIEGGFSTATSEAMACGLPVVITDIGENEKWVPPTLRFKPGDYQRLADIIIDLLRDEERRNFIGQENRKLIVNDNNYHQEMAKMEKLYMEVSNG